MGMNGKNGKAKRLRNRLVLGLGIVGVLLVAIAVGAETLGLDITPGFGMVQMFQLLLGMTALTVTAYLYLYGLRDEKQHSLQADIGVRLGLTGLVFAYVSGLSDLIGIGTHVTPSFTRPFVGPLQLGGLLLAGLIIIVGLLLYHTSRGIRSRSALEFIAHTGDDPK